MDPVTLSAVCDCLDEVVDDVIEVNLLVLVTKVAEHQRVCPLRGSDE
jgi:hypothetical protein